MKSNKAKYKSAGRYARVALRRAMMYYNTPEREAAQVRIMAKLKEAQSALTKYLLLINSGALVATMGMMGQIHEPLNKFGYMDTVSIGAFSFLLAIVLIGFALATKVMIHLLKLLRMDQPALRLTLLLALWYLLIFGLFILGAFLVLYALMKTF